MPPSQERIGSSSPVYDTLNVSIELDTQASASQDNFLQVDDSQDLGSRAGEHFHDSAIEPDQEGQLAMAQTQEQNSFGSLVEETQLTGLEGGTQASVDLPEDPRSQSQSVQVFSQKQEQTQRRPETPFLLSRPPLDDPSPVGFVYGQVPPRPNTCSMTRAPGKTDNNPQINYIPASETPSSRLVESVPAIQPTIQPRNNKPTSVIKHRVQEIATSQTLAEATSSFQSTDQTQNTTLSPHKAPSSQIASQSRKLSVPSCEGLPIRVVDTQNLPALPLDETLLQAIKSTARESLQSGNLPMTKIKVPVISSAQKGLHLPQAKTLTSFINDDSMSNSRSNHVLNCAESTLAPVPAYVAATQNSVPKDLPNSPNHVQSNIPHSTEGGDIAAPDTPVVDIVSNDNLTLNHNRATHASQKEHDNEGSRASQNPKLPASVILKPPCPNTLIEPGSVDGKPYHNDVSLPTVSKVPASVSHEPRTNLQMNPGSASTMHLLPPQNPGESTQQSSNSTTRAVRQRSKSNRSKAPADRKTLRRSLVTKQPLHQHQSGVRSIAIGKRIPSTPFPDQINTSHKRSDVPHSLRQAMEVPSNLSPPVQSAKNSRRRSFAAGSFFPSAGSRHPEARENGADSFMNKSGQQAHLVHGEAERHPVETVNVEVLSQQSTVRVKTVMDGNDSQHQTAAFLIQSVEQRELLQSESAGCEPIFVENVEVQGEDIDPTSSRHISPAALATVEVIMEEVGENGSVEKSEAQFGHHIAQSREEQLATGYEDEISHPQEELSDFASQPQHPQQGSRVRPERKTMRNADHNDFQQSPRHFQTSTRVMSNSGASQEPPFQVAAEAPFQGYEELPGLVQAYPEPDLQNPILQSQPPSRARSRNSHMADINNHMSCLPWRHDGEHESQQSSMQPRSESRRSNMGTPVNRLSRAKELHKTRKSTPAIRVQDPYRIQKQPSHQKEIQAEDWIREAVDCEKKIQHLRQNALNALNAQLELKETEKNEEIQKLWDANTEAQETIEQLQREKEEKELRLSHHAKATARYEKHMNGVVKMQDFLTGANARIDSNTRMIAAESRKLRSLISAREKQEKAVAECRVRKDKLHALIAANNLQLEKQVATLTESEKALKISEADLKHKLELESVRTQGLKEQIEVVKIGRQGFADILKEISGTVASELIKKDGILAKLLAAGCSTQSKVDKVMAEITALKDAAAEPSPTLTKALEDFFTELEDKLPRPNDDDIDPAARIVDDLKIHFDKVLIDLEAQNKLKSQIAELERNKTELISASEAQANQLQGLANKIEGLEQSFEATKGDLEEKTREFDTLRANPPEDPVLINKVRDYENRYKIAQQKVEAAAQDAAKDKQELAALKESIVKQKEELKQLESRIKTMDEEKTKQEEASSLELQNLREEFEKAQDDSRTTVQHEHQAELKIRELKQVEMESALNQTREETQKAREEHNKIQSERDKLKGFVTESQATLQRLEQLQPSIEDSKQVRAQIQTAEEKTTHTDRQLQSLSENMVHQNELNSQKYQDYVMQLNCVNQLQNKNETLVRQTLKLKEAVVVSQRSSMQPPHTSNNAAPTNPAPRREPGEQQLQPSPGPRRESRPAQRKASVHSQDPRSTNYTIQALENSELSANPRMATERRPEKGVTFSDRPSYSATPDPASSPSSPLHDATGKVNVRELGKLKANMVLNAARGLPLVQEITRSNAGLLSTVKMLSNNNVVDKIGGETLSQTSTWPTKGVSRTAQAFAPRNLAPQDHTPDKRTNDTDASRSQHQPLKSALKGSSRSQQTFSPESPHGFSTLNVDKAQIPQDVFSAQKQNKQSEWFSRSKVLGLSLAVGTSSKIVAGKFAVTHLSDQLSAQESPRQESSRISQSVLGKRPAPSGTEATAAPRKKSISRRKPSLGGHPSNRPSSLRLVFPDSQDGSSDRVTIADSQE